MLVVTVIALHLALAQAPAAEPPAAAPAASAREEAAPAVRAPAEAPAAAPAAAESESAKAPAPSDATDATGTAGATGDEDALRTTRELPPPARMRTRQRVKSALNPIPSLLSAEPLGGRSAVLGWAGWSSFGAGWAQGVTPEDDLGAVGDLDWATGELRVSAFYRRPLGRVGAVEIASRLRAGWYADFGAKWIHDDNEGDRGVEFVPAIVLSTRGAGGVFSLGGELPIVVTLWRNGGIFAAPRLSFSFETLLYGDLTVGVRVGGSYRAGAGDAPMSEPRALLDLQVLAGWKIL